MGKSTRQFSHLAKSGEARMVDVGGKPVLRRQATATATLRCARATIDALRRQALPKGDVLAAARLAGILAAKKTADLIPLCHSLPLDEVTVDFTPGATSVKITATARTRACTGVEMEALTAAAVAALTLYDMMKSADRAMRIEGLRLVSKEKSAA